MKKRLWILLATIVAFVIPVTASAQVGGNGYLDLNVDPFIQGGLNGNIISNELLPYFAGYAPHLKDKSEEVITFAFNYDIPKLQLSFRSKNGKVYTRTGKLKAGSKLVATINKRIDRGDYWDVHATVRWVDHCGNVLPYPFEVVLEIPKWGTQVVIKAAAVVQGDMVVILQDRIIQQIVPEVGNLTINVPPAEQSKWRIVEVGHEEAGRRLDYKKDFWDYALELLKVVAAPIGQIFGRTKISITANGGAGGAGGEGGDSSSSSSSSSSASASASAAAAAAAAGGGNSPQALLTPAGISALLARNEQWRFPDYFGAAR